MLFDNFLMRSTATDTILLWPCAVSTTIRSHSASISASVRSSPLSPTVVAAATRRRADGARPPAGQSEDRLGADARPTGRRRKRGVEGKRVDVRVDRSGGGMIQKKTKKKENR